MRKFAAMLALVFGLMVMAGSAAYAARPGAEYHGIRHHSGHHHGGGHHGHHHHYHLK